MPNPVIADTFRVALKWKLGTTPNTAVNVMHFSQPGGTPSTVFATLDTNVNQNMWYWCGDDAVVDAVDITPLNGFSATSTFNTGGPLKWKGDGGLDVILQGAGIIKATTGVGGRSYRGRTFLPFVGEQRQSSGVMGNVPLVQTAWSNFLTAMSAVGVFPAIASYKLGLQTPVSAYLAEPQIATQRRRNKR